jgi:2,3-bisphosphoglycerate-dependent phosphoglycerate mutase
MAKLWVLRHGESEWNLQNRFTGWTDVGLSDRGKAEAREAGEQLKGVRLDVLYTSVLSRAIETARLALEASGHGFESLPRLEDQALNERHYGDLQGLNKAEIGKQYGQEQLHKWRRSYDIQPPNGESLKDTKDRVMPYWQGKILPDLKAGKHVLVSAHGNSIRAMVMELSQFTPEEIPSIEIPTGYAFSYTVHPDGSATCDVNIRELNAEVKKMREEKAAKSSG